MPFIGEQRPEHLVELLTTRGHECAPQHALFNRTELAHHGVAAGVGHRGARLEAADADGAEGEVEKEPRRVEEETGAPERRAEHEAPLGGVKRGIQLANLQQAHRAVGPSGHDREGGVAACLPLATAPVDEPAELLGARGRSRDETRDLGGRKHRRERRGVGRPELAKGDPVPNQRRQGVAPRGGWRGDDTWRHRREEMLLLHTVLPTRV